jgi:protocatechuate 3,4-dioxygenase beta subunit
MNGSVNPDRRLDRRAFLVSGGLATLGLALAACGSSGDGSSSGGASTSGGSAGDQAATTTPASPTSTASSTTAAGAGTTAAAATTAAVDTAFGTPATTVFTAADFAGLGTCILSPEQTEGPFPSPTLLERRDVTEGLAGYPLRVGVQVVDADCTPIPGAVVEIWHCDVDGDYSAYRDGATADDAGEGTAFLRGSQTANDEGIVEFHTICPGWYRGRAVHIHTKVWIDGSPALVSQMYFSDDQNAAIFSGDGAYAERGLPDTTNAQDGVARGADPASNGTQMTVSDDAEIGGSRALLVLGLGTS